jgi:hypothetical protein
LCGVAPDPCFLNQNLHLKNLHVNKLERVVGVGGGVSAVRALCRRRRGQGKSHGGEAEVGK